MAAYPNNKNFTHMKKLFILMALMASLCSRAADLRLAGGSLDWLKDMKLLTAEFDCSKAKWNNNRDWEEYVARARRVDDWELKSMEYFYEWFNDEITTITARTANDKVRHKAVVQITNVDNGGRITANILLVDIPSGEIMATFLFRSSDGDSDDHITMRDPMKQLGECLGKAFKKYLQTGKVKREKKKKGNGSSADDIYSRQ